MSEEKLHNEDFDVIRVDGDATNSNDPIKGNFNKIKLKIISYAITMEVQEAYMQEEMKQKEAIIEKMDKDQKKTTGKEKRDVRNKILGLKADLNDLKTVYEEYIKSHKRFTDMAKRALNLPSENFEEMKRSEQELSDEGLNWINVDETEKKSDLNTENIINDVSSPYDKSQSTLEKARDEDIFSSVDSDAIKEEIDKFMNKKVNSEGEQRPLADVIAGKVTADNLETLTKEVSKNINQIGMDDVKDLFDSTGTLTDSTKKSTQEPEVPIVNINDVADIKEGEWTEDTIASPTDTITFDSDTSMSDYMSRLEKDTQELKAKRERIATETEKALQAKKTAETAKDNAKARSESTLKELEELKKNMPRIQELLKEKRRAQEALEAEMTNLTSINSDKEAIDAETEEYNAQTGRALEELRRMQAILKGEEPDEPAPKYSLPKGAHR